MLLQICFTDNESIAKKDAEVQLEKTYEKYEKFKYSESQGPEGTHLRVLMELKFKIPALWVNYVF